MKWPSFLPKNCPPDDAVPADGVVYRLVRQDPPAQRDFVPQRNAGSRSSFPGSECIASGLSVLRELDDAVRLRKRVPAFKNRTIARGELRPEAGVTRHTPSKKDGGGSHLTWWVPEGFDPTPFFMVVAGGAP